MAPKTTTGRPALQLDFPQSLAVYDDYASAQKAVDYLSDEEFPVQNLMIVGTELKQVERVTGRLTWGKVAMVGAASGAWFGVFVGLILGIFAEDGMWLDTFVFAVLIGLLFGLVWGLIGYAFSGGQRDFTSVSQVIATRYEVLVEHKHLAAAQELLTRMPGSAPPL